MKNLLKNKLLVAAVVVVVLVIGVGGFIFMQTRATQDQELVIEEVQNVKELAPEDIGLELSIDEDNKIITLEATKLDGITSIEYDVSYDAQVTENGEEFVATRGVTGMLPVTSGESIVSKDIDLGTCSRNVCKYDTVVSEVVFNIRVNFENGEVGGIEATVPIE